MDAREGNSCAELARGWNDLMNCDQVFSILTRGPFPTGHPSDVDVERHLAKCADCRRLAEALRPALELDQESISSDESRDLPGYWAEMLDHGPMRSASHPLALVARVPAALHQRLDRGRHWIARRTGRNGLRFTAAIFVGAAIGLLMRNAADVAQRPVESPGSAQPTTPNAVSDNAIGPVAGPVPALQASPHDTAVTPATPHQQVTAEVVRRRLLAALTLAPACFGIDRLISDETGSTPPEVVRLLAQADVSQLHCCTECHTAQGGTPLPAALTTVTRSCAICHR